jgi:hypothetical protein
MVWVTGGGASDGGTSLAGGGASDAGGGTAAVVVAVVVVDDGDGVLSLFRSTNHTANAMASSATTRPAISRANGLRRRSASYWSVSGSNRIGGRGPAIPSVGAAPA